jgi:hypothetical protein
LPTHILGHTVFETFQIRHPTTPHTANWNSITVNNLDEAQDLLEALEDLGFTDR